MPVRVPLVVRDLLEARLARDARVVHEDVETAECGHRIGNGPLRPTAPRKIDLHVRGLTDPGTTSPSTGNDSRALRDE